MFTGIIESMGRIEAIDAVGGDRRFTIVADDDYLDGLRLGDSVAINGVCLTAVAMPPRGLVADVSAETLSATTVGIWNVGHAVNLERAARPETPLGGHLVSGHVDGLATLVEAHEDARSWRLTFEAPAALARYIARKGSVTLDGISLTVNSVENRRFGVNIIPHTWSHTTLGRLKTGAAVNLEVDLVARYLERLLQAREDDRG